MCLDGNISISFRPMPENNAGHVPPQEHENYEQVPFDDELPMKAVKERWKAFAQLAQGGKVDTSDLHEFLTKDMDLRVANEWRNFLNVSNAEYHRRTAEARDLWSLLRSHIYRKYGERTYYPADEINNDIQQYLRIRSCSIQCLTWRGIEAD